MIPSQYPRHYRWLIGRLYDAYPYGRFWDPLRRECEQACNVSGYQAAAALKSLRDSGIVQQEGELFLAWTAATVLGVLGLTPGSIMDVALAPHSP